MGQCYEDQIQEARKEDTKSFTIFTADTWIPDWAGTEPGKELALHLIPAECVAHLEPDPHIAIDIHLEGQEAHRHSQIISRQGEYVPMQFRGLAYESYPIRGNHYARHTFRDGNVFLDAKFRVLDKGFRTLRINNRQSSIAQARLINFAIDNPDPVRLIFQDWTVGLSSAMREHEDSSRFSLTHSIDISHRDGRFTDTDLGTFIDRIRLVFSIINMQCCEIVPIAAYDERSETTSYMIHQLHCDPYDELSLFYPTIWDEESYQRLQAAASKIYDRIIVSPPHYLEGLDWLVCNTHESIPSFWTILEKTCGSGPNNVRTALRDCVESIQIPSEHLFLKRALSVRNEADFVDVFYEMRNHMAHERNKIAKGLPIPPEAHTIVSRLAELLAWAKVLTDVKVDSWLLHEARASFADWQFEHTEGHPTMLKKFGTDGTYNALSAIRRLVRGGEIPGKVSAHFVTPDGRLAVYQPVDWPAGLS